MVVLLRTTFPVDPRDERDVLGNANMRHLVRSTDSAFVVSGCVDSVEVSGALSAGLHPRLTPPK